MSIVYSWKHIVSNWLRNYYSFSLKYNTILKGQFFSKCVVLKKGTKMYLADTLSRAYIKEHKQDVKHEVVLEIERSEAETESELIQMLQY
jgi:hypothetical protein